MSLLKNIHTASLGLLALVGVTVANAADIQKSSTAVSARTSSNGAVVVKIVRRTKGGEPLCFS